MSWKQNIRTVEPYVPGEQPDRGGIIKLNTNECPYPPAPGVEKRARELNCAGLRLYPDPDSRLLTETLARYYGIEPEQVFVGVGSDDVLAMSFLTFFNSDLPVLFPDITYSFYDVWAELYRIPYEVCPLDDEFHIAVSDYKRPNGGIIFPNPNAPTGVLERTEVIEEILQANQDSVVIVDEAYIDFGGESVLPLIYKYDNLLVVQTFSKSRAMAGCRIGFAMGSRELIKYLSNVKFSFNSYTMNLPSQILGVEAVKDRAYFETTVKKIIDTRERCKAELAGMGFSFPDSMGNFIFAAHKKVPAGEIFEALKSHNIYVRYWNKPRISSYLRITVGTDDEMNSLLAFLREYLENR